VVDGEVVIKQGTPVRRHHRGCGSEAPHGAGLASCSNTVNETKARRSQRQSGCGPCMTAIGDSNVTSTAVTTVAVGVFVPVAAPFFLLRKGTTSWCPRAHASRHLRGRRTLVRGQTRQRTAVSRGTDKSPHLLRRARPA
jgi:hypothetical protein